jgi:Na+-transporting methylmalonyl-CoA/oxaloacetate decarboxylase gamma subunit
VDRALGGVALVLALLALVMSYLGRAVLRPEAFADRAVATLHDQAVQDDVADHLTDAFVSGGGGDLVAVRPAIRALTGSIIGTKPFAALFRRGVLDAHRAATHQHGGAIFVSVRDAAVLIDGALARFAPDAAKTLGAERVATLLTLRPGAVVLDLVRIAERVYTAAWVAAIVAMLLALAAIWVSPDRRDTVRRLGFGLAVGGLVIVAVYVIGGVVVRHAAPAGRGAVAAAVWRSFLGGLRGQALIAATPGRRRDLAAAANRRRCADSRWAGAVCRADRRRRCDPARADRGIDPRRDCRRYLRGVPGSEGYDRVDRTRRRRADRAPSRPKARGSRPGLGRARRRRRAGRRGVTDRRR